MQMEQINNPDLILQKMSYKYAFEADLLNMELLGKTAKQWHHETVLMLPKNFEFEHGTC